MENHPIFNVKQIREIMNAEPANRLLEQGWILLDTRVMGEPSESVFVYALGWTRDEPPAN
ncbi:hypothetical protein ACODYM_29455 [Burkholderia gladioli]|uniref:hypothetical protein n=1 Tax=Burkholderia gladioli TaxID=28095 RepID=UPI003B507685